MVDVKVMKTEGKLRLRIYKGLLNLKITVVDVNLMKTDGKLRFPSLERLWGAIRGPEASQRGPGDFQERTPDDPNRFLGVPLGCLLGPGSEGGRGLQGDNPGDPKGASRLRGAQVLEKYKKTMRISFRINVHAVEARSPN